MNELKHFCESLKFYREEKGLSVYQAACKSGLNWSNYNNLETMATSPQLKTVINICKALNLELIIRGGKIILLEIEDN